MVSSQEVFLWDEAVSQIVIQAVQLIHDQSQLHRMWVWKSRSAMMISHICYCMWMICWLLREIRHIQKLKFQLKKVDMKDLRKTKKILGIGLVETW